MNPRARVEAALALDVADRPPVGAWGHDYLSEWSPRDLAESHIRAQRRFGWDFVKFQPRATCFGEAFGSEFRPSGDPHEGPVFVRTGTAGASDLAGIEPVRIDTGPLADQVASLRRVAEALGQEVPVIQTVFSPLSVADFVLGEGPKAIIPALRDHPEAVARAMGSIAATLVDFIGASVDAGAAGIFFAVVQLATEDLLSQREYEELVLPFDLRVLQALPSAAWFNVAHLCGSRIHFGLSRLLPVQAISWSANDLGNPSLEDGIQLSGKAAMGGVGHQTTLLTGPEEAIAAEASGAAAANGGRGIFVAPGCSVPTRTPPSHLSALADSLLKGRG